MSKIFKTQNTYARVLSILLAVFLLIGVIPPPVTYAAEIEGDEFDQLRQRWLDFTIGDSEWDPTNPNYALKLMSLEGIAQANINLMVADPVSNSRVFSDYPLGNKGSWYDSNKMQSTYQRIKEIATAYATRGNRFYKDEATRDIIIQSLDYMYQYHFNENVNSYQNWFSWLIGSPISLMATTMLMWEDLTPEQITNYAKPCLKWQTNSFVPRTDTGTNGIWRRKADLYVGIVTKNADILQETQEFYPKFLNFVTGGDGFYADGTHIYHGYNMYNGGYGTGHFRDIVELLYYLNGSRWDVGSNDLSNVYKIAYDAFIPLLPNGMMMDLSRGRDVTRPGGELAVGQSNIATLMRLADSSKNEADRVYINGYLKEWLSNDIVNQNFNAIGTISEITMKNKLMSNYNYRPIGSVQSYHQYAVGDKAVYNSDKGFAAGLAMYSRRIYHLEAGDSNNKGWNINKGRLYLYTDDIKQNEDAVKASIDWDRLPGTTVVRGTGRLSEGFGRTGAFAGGVSFDGKYGLSAMFLRDKDNTLDAKKSYFFFDDEIVELGSGITASDNKATETILENIKLDGENTLIVDGDSKPTAIGTTQQLVNPKYLWVEGNTSGSNFGVYFPEDTTLVTERNSRSGKMSDLGDYNTGLNSVLTRNYLTMYKSHGMNPVNDSYAFVLLPNRQHSDTSTYSTSPDVQILKHEENTHAVYEKNLNILGLANFSTQKGTVDAYGIPAYMSVDGIATVMSQESGQTLSLSVADPTQASTGTVTVTINRAATAIISKDPRVNVVQTTPYIQLDINTGGSKGQSIQVVLSTDPLDGPSAPTTAPEKPELQYTIDSNGINIFFDDVEGTSHKLYYGTESGNYTQTVDLGGSTASYISNLIDDATYYFKVDATNAVGTTSSDELQVVFTDGKPYYTFIEDFNNNDLSKAYMLSPTLGWAWEILPDFGFLGYCIRRPSNAVVSELTYAVPGMTGFDLNAWQSGDGGYASKYAAITFYTAATEADVTANNWTLVTPSNIVAENRAPKFYKDDYTMDGMENANYLKISIAATGNAAWAPNLDRLTVRYSKDTASTIAPTGINPFIHQNTVNVNQTADIAFSVLPSTASPAQVAKIVWTVQNSDLVEITGSTVNTVSVKGLVEGATNLVATYEGTQIAIIPLTVQLYRLNLALNKPVTLSRTPAFPASNAVDGDESTRFGYNNIGANPGWITFTVNMGQSFEVTDVNILWAGPKNTYSLEYSTDNVTWTRIDRYDPLVKPAWENYTFATPIQAHYMRVAVNSFTGNYGMSMYEFQVFGNVPPPNIDSIIVTPTSLSLLKGQTAKLSAMAAPSTADVSTIEWESSDPSIATVDKLTGFVTTLSVGDVTITAKDVNPTGQNASGSCAVTVIDSGGTTIGTLVNSIELNPEGSIWLQLGKTQAITSTVLPDDATNKYLTYSSSNVSIASVDNKGVITAHANGNAVITVMNSASGIKSELAVRAAEYVDDIEAAKALLESLDFGATPALTQAEAKQYIENILADLAPSLNGVTATIVAGDVFTPATYGTESGPVGTAGSYTFKLSLTKGVTSPGNIQAILETIDLTVPVEATAIHNAIISPLSVSYDLNDPVDVSTTITWNDASSVTGVVYGANPVAINETCVVTTGSVLTIKSTYLATLGLVKGSTAEFVISFDKGNSVTFTVIIIDSSEPAPASYNITVESDNNGIASANVTTSAVVGVEIILSATPNAGYHFKEWQVISPAGLIITGNTFTMPDEAVTVKAIFEEDPVANYTLTVNNSSASGSGAGSYTEGATVTIKAGSLSKYTFKGWSSNDGVTFDNIKNATTTFTMPAKHVTVTATWSYNGGSSDSGGGNSSPSAPVTQVPVTQNYSVDIKVTNTEGNDTKNISVPITVDAKTGTAVLDITSNNNLVSNGGTSIIEIPSIPDVYTYKIGIPVSDMSTTDKQGALMVNTDIGSITVPSNMLTGVTGITGTKAEISMGQGDKSELPEAAKTVIGDRPLIQLSMSIDGKQLEWNNSDAAVTVTIPYTPSASELANPEGIIIWYIDGSGKLVAVPNGQYDQATGNVIFTTTHFSYYAVGYNRVSFTDVAANAWYKNAVDFIAARGITVGTGNGNFSPNAKLSRGEFLVMLMKAYQIASDEKPLNNFTDAGSKYYTDYLATAKRLGLAEGVGNNMFAPDKEITRQEMFALVYNVLKAIDKLPQRDSGKSISNFSDAGEIAPWAMDAMTLLVETGTVGGSAGQLNSTSTTTRSEMAQVLYNLLSQ